MTIVENPPTARRTQAFIVGEFAPQKGDAGRLAIAKTLRPSIPQFRLPRQ